LQMTGSRVLRAGVPAFPQLWPLSVSRLFQAPTPSPASPASEGTTHLQMTGSRVLRAGMPAVPQLWPLSVPRLFQGGAAHGATSISFLSRSRQGRRGRQRLDPTTVLRMREELLSGHRPTHHISFATKGSGNIASQNGQADLNVPASKERTMANQTILKPKQLEKVHVQKHRGPTLLGEIKITNPDAPTGASTTADWKIVKSLQAKNLTHSQTSTKPLMTTSTRSPIAMATASTNHSRRHSHMAREVTLLSLPSRLRISFASRWHRFHRSANENAKLAMNATRASAAKVQVWMKGAFWSAMDMLCEHQCGLEDSRPAPLEIDD